MDIKLFYIVVYKWNSYNFLYKILVVMRVDYMAYLCDSV